jgi:type IV fimbrial biogenesis protein FimT
MSASRLNRPLSASCKLALVLSRPVNSTTSSSGNATQMSPPTDSSQAARTARSRPAFRRQSGFNLVELLVVVTLAAILMGFGAPSFRYITNSNRVSSEVNLLLGDMMMARSEAIREGMTVTVCPSTTGTSCDTNPPGWQEGWIVFTDFNSNGAVDAGAPNNDTVVRRQTQFSGTDTLTTTNANNPWVSFNRDGFAINMNTNANQHLLFSLQTTPANTQWKRCLEITLAGQTTTEHAGQGEC